jgi:hypothetical protein
MTDGREQKFFSNVTGADDRPRVSEALIAGAGDDAAAGEHAEPTGNNLEERLAFIRSLWNAKRDGKGIPARVDLDPAEFHRLWPVTFLLEREGETADWRVRFAGSAYGSVYGREITGARVSDIVPAPLAPQVLEDLRRCVEVKEPIVIDGRN